MVFSNSFRIAYNFPVKAESLGSYKLSLNNFCKHEDIPEQKPAYKTLLLNDSRTGALAPMRPLYKDLRGSKSKWPGLQLRFFNCRLLNINSSGIENFCIRFLHINP